jgi:molybdenum cofactor guanylyltransferase
MGSDKASLPWHGSTLLRQVCGLAARGVDGPVLVVRAPGQQLPALPRAVEVFDDPTEGLGPLQGIAVGLAALADRADVAFVCATDAPFLHPAFIRRLVQAWDRAVAPVDVVLAVAHGHPQPLAAAYRTGLAPLAAKLVAAGRLRPAFLFDECVVLRLDEEALLIDRDLQAADPFLDSVVNLNGPDDYTTALARPAPEISVECFGVVAAGRARGARAVRAATVGAAAQAAGVTWDRHVLAAVNGDQTGRDGGLPLVAGDTVAFLSAAAGG